MRVVRVKAAGAIRDGVLDSSHAVEGGGTRADAFTPSGALGNTVVTLP
jgi:hypothetical protein